MRVLKRCGQLQEVSFDKVLQRIKTLCDISPKCSEIDPTELAQKVISRIYDKVSTMELDELAAQIAVSLGTINLEWQTLANRIIISNNHKNTNPVFSEVIGKLRSAGLVSKQLFEVVEGNHELLNNTIDHNRDYTFDYFSFKTLEKAYLIQLNNVVQERIQYMWMRVAIGIHGDDIERVIESYEGMSGKYFTHATPTLFHAGTEFPQLLSCFLLGVQDSVDGIYKTISDCAMISKWAGGIGIHVSNIRAKGSLIRGTNGKTDGIIPMLRVFNETARYINQCFTPDTVVYTKNGHKSIDSVTSKDYVLTKDGSFKRVLGIVRNSVDEEIMSIRTTHSIESVQCTNVHEICVLRNQKKMTPFTKIIDNLNKNSIEAEFIPASEITSSDFMLFPKPNYELDVPEYSEEVCRFYGILLGNGHYTKKKNCSSIECGITCGYSKQDTLDFVKGFLQERNIHLWEVPGVNCVSIRWTYSQNIPITYEQLYKDTEKYIPGEFLHLPRPKQMQIIRGLIETDGSIQKEIYFNSSSRSLIEGMRYMLLCQGILTSGKLKNTVGNISSYKNIPTVKQPLVLRIPKHEKICEVLDIVPSKYLKFFEYDNILYSRVKKIEQEHYTGYVYDLNVEDNHNYVTHMGLVHNSGKRNGSFAIYLEPWHDDVFEFIECRKNHGDENARARDLFYALWIPDLFMKRVEEDGEWHTFCPDTCPKLVENFGDEFEKCYAEYVEKKMYRRVFPARKLWNEILKAQMETGTPYLCYKDAANRKSNQKNLGIIRSSNLCVAPDTKILTDKGYIEIQTLKNMKTNVWNGKEFSEVIVKQTGQDQELISVSFSNGSTLKCTKYHKFYIQKRFSPRNLKTDILEHSSVDVVEAQHLKQGMKIVKCEYPVIDGEKELKDAYTNGIFSGDGTYGNISDKNPDERQCKFKALDGKAYCKRHIDKQMDDSVADHCQGISYEKKPQVSLYGGKIQLLEHLSYRSHGKENNQGNVNKLNVCLPLDLEEKFFVPMNNYSLQSKLEWFAGYCDADGTVARNMNNQSLQLACIHKEFLHNVMLMLQTCGISSKVRLNRKARKTLLPDGKGGKKEYNCNQIWRLLISSTQLQKLVSLGFSPKRLRIISHSPQRNAEKFITIEKVEDLGDIDDTYCFNEPKRHAGLFGGVISQNCSEIMEYSDHKEYACCTLASIGLPKFVSPRTFDSEVVVTIFSKPNCSYCAVAEALCKRNGFTYTKKVLDQDYTMDELRAYISSQGHTPPERIPFPQIVMNSSYVGGFEGLHRHVTPVFDFDNLMKYTRVAIRNLDLIIDLNYYPVTETELSNKRHRPLGLGVQGLADVYAMMGYSFDSAEAAKLNKKIFATIHYAAMEESMTLAKEKGAYETFKGSPLSEGKFQFDLWEKEPEKFISDTCILDWELLRREVMEHGVRNSLLLAPMPTASTAQILGNNECIEPYTNNIYVRRVLAGDFVVINKYLIRDMTELGLWSEEMKDRIIMHNGSIQNIQEIPVYIRNIYKTVWDLSQKALIDQAADRGIYICQSQSLNLFLESPNIRNLSSMHFYSWQKGLKTGMYYLRSRPAANAQQFTVDPRLYQKFKNKESECESCSG